MADIITATEYINIDTIPLATPAWRADNVSELWQTADTSGSDVVIPGAHGARSHRRWRRPTERIIELVIFGDRDRTGTPYSNQRDGLWLNVKALRDAIVTDPGGNGTRTCTVHMAGGTTITGPVHVLGLGWAPYTPTTLRATLRISIPGGQLA